MKALILPLAAITLLAAPIDGSAQQTSLERLPPEQFDVAPPTDRVSGNPGKMKIQQTGCRALPTARTRRRIVDVAVQEWGFFGFSIVDETLVARQAANPGGRPSAGQPGSGPANTRRRFRRLDAGESERVAASIGGYWAVTPGGDWILKKQNEAWNGPGGVASRWRNPWSAAFVSWVMCEGGLGDSSQFQRAIAHHTYIDQAIRARDRNNVASAFVAYDIGEAAIEPGDLLCRGSRPAYRNLEERRRQMGVGARTHCDLVVGVDESRERIFAIGGNVRGSVSLKLLPAVLEEGKRLRPQSQSASRGRRAVFAHLKLRAEPIEPDALGNSPTVKALTCTAGLPAPSLLAARNLAAAGIAGNC
jgi:hypothetical protein